MDSLHIHAAGAGSACAHHSDERCRFPEARHLIADRWYVAQAVLGFWWACTTTTDRVLRGSNRRRICTAGRPVRAHPGAQQSVGWQCLRLGEPQAPLKPLPDARPARHDQLAGRGLTGDGPTRAALVRRTSLRHHLWRDSMCCVNRTGESSLFSPLSTPCLDESPYQRSATTRRRSQVSRSLEL